MSEAPYRAAKVANFALLASLVLRTIREMRQAEHYDEAAQPSDQDLHRLDILHDLFVSSWRAALPIYRLRGEERSLPQEQVTPKKPRLRAGYSPTEAKQTYYVIQRLLENGRAASPVIQFMSQATAALESLRAGGWQELETQHLDGFVTTELERFLERASYLTTEVGERPTAALP